MNTKMCVHKVCGNIHMPISAIHKSWALSMLTCLPYSIGCPYANQIGLSQFIRRGCNSAEEMQCLWMWSASALWSNHLEEDELSVHRKHYMNTKVCFHKVCGDNHMPIGVIWRSWLLSKWTCWMHPCVWSHANWIISSQPVRRGCSPPHTYA